jgi:hypothetical protein
MSLFDAVASLPFTVAEHSRSVHRRDTSSGFERVSTEFALSGKGYVGRGEDVTYDAEDHEALAISSLAIPTGEFRFREFSRALDDVALFPAKPPEREVSRDYRRWALESAALDLALRQNDTDLGSEVGERSEPVSFVVSTRLGDPPSVDRLRDLLAVHDDLRFKLDPTSDWDDDLVAAVADLADVAVLDVKNYYEGTEVDSDPDPALYERLFAAFPDAVVEDAKVTPETEGVLDANQHRLSWDAPVHGVDSIEALPYEPSWLNVKPSRFGTVRSLSRSLEYCFERDVSLYGGGQFELGVGRQHVQTLASLFYPDAPNDVAPGGYNDPDPTDDLPASPLEPSRERRGLEF